MWRACAILRLWFRSRSDFWFTVCPQNSASEIPASDCGYEQPIPAWFIALADYTWFVCLPLTPLFLPHNPVAVVSQPHLRSQLAQPELLVS